MPAKFPDLEKISEKASHSSDNGRLEQQFQDQLDDESDKILAADRDALAEKVKDLTSNRNLREKTAKWSFVYLWFLTIIVFGILFVDGFCGANFSLGTSVLTTLAGGTFASAIALPAIAMRGLFKVEEGANSPKKKKR